MFIFKFLGLLEEEEEGALLSDTKLDISFQP
jgi:hypothetical protein